MKKVTQGYRENHEYILHPYALRRHTHDNYVETDGTSLLIFTRPVEFQGPVSGIDSAGTDVFVTAAVPISALRILSSQDTSGVYADPSQESSVRKIIGMSVTAGTTGAQIKMLSYGKHTDGSWSFDPNLPLYLGDNGTITQVTPITGNVVVLGHAQSATTIFLDIKQPIVLS